MEFKSLVDLCVITIIDNLDKIGDVGDTEPSLLKRIFEHCNADQLKHIEMASEGRDLSEATDSMWKRFYGRRWGTDTVKSVQAKMVQKGFRFTWRQLWDAKESELEEQEERSVARMREAYQDAQRVKQERRVQVCNVLPPGAKSKGSKSSFGGKPGAGGASQRGRLMAKAKKDYAASRERSTFQALKKKHEAFAMRSAPKQLPSTTGNLSRLKSPAVVAPLRVGGFERNSSTLQQPPRIAPGQVRSPTPHGSMGIKAPHTKITQRPLSSPRIPEKPSGPFTFRAASVSSMKNTPGTFRGNRGAEENVGGNRPLKRQLPAVGSTVREPPKQQQKRNTESFARR